MQNIIPGTYQLKYNVSLELKQQFLSAIIFFATSL